MPYSRDLQVWICHRRRLTFLSLSSAPETCNVDWSVVYANDFVIWKNILCTQGHSTY